MTNLMRLGARFGLVIVMVPAMLATELSNVEAGPAQTSHAQARPLCQPLREIGCPDFSSTINAISTWRVPNKVGPNGLLWAQETYAEKLRETVLVVWYRPVHARFDAANEKQGLGILNTLVSEKKLRDGIAIVRTLRYDGRTLTLDNYVFLRDQGASWRRNRDAVLVNKLIMSNLPTLPISSSGPN